MQPLTSSPAARKRSAARSTSSGGGLNSLRNDSR